MLLVPDLLDTDELFSDITPDASSDDPVSEKEDEKLLESGLELSIWLPELAF